MIDWKRVILAIVILVLIIFGIIFIISKFHEDSWIKDSKGVWIMHGNPKQTPPEAREQQVAISCASELYASKNLEGMNFSSQCLGSCGNYSIDIVHVPRISEDDLKENQCSDYLNKKTNHFMELNAVGNIVRIV